MSEGREREEEGSGLPEAWPEGGRQASVEDPRGMGARARGSAVVRSPTAWASSLDSALELMNSDVNGVVSMHNSTGGVEAMERREGL